MTVILYSWSCVRGGSGLEKPLKPEDYQVVRLFDGVVNMMQLRGVFRAISNSYDGAILPKYSKPLTIFVKSSIIGF